MSEVLLQHVQRKSGLHAASSFTPVRSGLLQRKCARGGTPAPSGECEAHRKEKLQRRPRSLPAPSSISHQQSTASHVPPIVHEALRSLGQSLDGGTRDFMEARFGHDFSHVRVHTDPRAEESARTVNAVASTVGNDIAFDTDRYATGTQQGQCLLAHELTHVVQQSGAEGIRVGRRDEKRGLSPSTADMEYALGADFSAVRIHSNSRAARASRTLNAQAFTYEEKESERISHSSSAAFPATNAIDVNKRGGQPVSDGPATATHGEELSSERAGEPSSERAQEPSSETVRSADKQNGPVADAPSATYIVPFDRSLLAAPGERVIFRGDFTGAPSGDYQLEYSTTGGHFDSAVGPTTRTIAGLVSGNVNFFVPTPWDGTATVEVVLKVRKKSDNSVTQTETWTFGLKMRYPTTMTQREGTGETNLPGIYTYDIGPVVIPYVAPYYQHQTILERFGNWSLANIVPADIVPAYRTAHSLNSAAAVSQHFLGNYAGNNGTFTVDANDQIADQHGGHPDLSNLVSNLATPKAIEVALPQTYEAKPGTALGNYMVTRVLKADGTTWKVKKGVASP